ncbi:MAG: DNA polymerase Y family protein, partial [Hyphomonadaceae bacterium]
HEDARVLDRIAAFCERWTPSVVLDSPDGIFLEIAGAAHLFGGEEKMRALIRKRLGEHGYGARVGVADTPGAAWALAHFSNDLIAPAGESEKALAPLPIAGLRLEPQGEALLKRLGLSTIGDLIARPRAPFAARVGERAQRLLDEALGRAEPALTYRRPPPEIFATRQLLEPLMDADSLFIAAKDAAADIADLVERRGLGVRRLGLTLYAVSGTPRRIVIGFSTPERAPEDLAKPFLERLRGGAESFNFEFGVEAIRLDALETARYDADADRTSARLVDALAARLGADAVERLACADRHTPEAAEIKESALRPPAANAAPARAPRPLKLFARPELIEAIAPIPDGAPMRFRWRRVLREVAHAEGPERIAGEWMHKEAPTRDYFQIEDQTGARYWIFREGLYGRETNAPRWFVHGLFG